MFTGIVSHVAKVEKIFKKKDWEIAIIINDEKSIEIITLPNDFTKINEELEKSGFKKELAELTMKAENEINLKGDDALRMQKILDILEDLDDVQEVYTNANFEV